MFGIQSRAFQVLSLVLTSTHLVTGGIACLGNPCLHGICIDDLNSTYSCYCVDGYTGVQCQTNWDECWSAPCQNGGTCLDGIASYNCSCPDGFIGDNCETNYNECESNPCLNNGTCVDLNNGYLCACAAGFAGEHCELDAAVCDSTEEARCHNGGRCIEGPGLKFYCRCLAGWAGQKCEQQIDECESDPCQNGGVCIDAHADYMCACAYGFTGKSCETPIEFCDENSCSNDALCVVEDGFRVCYCVPDYHGERCELQYDECQLGPRCMNGGTCIDGVDNFTCSCPPRLTGSFCECLILDDESYDCEYVSPTPIPQSTYETTTDAFTDTTTDTALTTTWDYSVTVTVPPDIITTTVSTSTETEEFTTPDKEIIETTLDVDETYTPTETDVYVTSATEIKETVESEDSKTESTAAVTTERESTELITTVASTDPATNVITDLVTLPPTTMAETETTEVIEVTTVPEIDATTGRMFTDTPTEHAVTDQATTSITATTEVTEFTTAFDNTSFSYTTVQSVCSESVCNNFGTCVNTPQGIRCHCPFNYGGRFCEEKISISSAAFSGSSFVAHKLRNSTSISIEFKSKTLITDGQLMNVEMAKGVYVQLYMSSGLLKFKFSCGYQTMLLSELKTYVNKGYPMKIEARLDLFPTEQHCNATLRLNDTVAMSGGQVARVSALDNNTMLYFGNRPDVNDTENMPFVGCIWDLMVNGEEREVFGEAVEAGDVSECSSLACLSSPCLNGGTCSDQGESYTCSCANGWMGLHCERSVCSHNPCRSGGSCVPHPGSGFLCLCPYGKHGIFCEYNVEITRPSLAPISNEISSYLIYPLSQASSERFELRLRFHAADMEQIALLAFVGQSGAHDARSHHMALTFVKGYVMLTWNMGGGPRRVFTARALGARRGGHAVRVWRRGRAAGLSVDGRHNATGNAPAHDNKMTVLPYVYIGGHPSPGFRALPHDLPLHGGWRGCVWDVTGPGVGRALGGRGVGQCGVAQCSAKSCNAPRGVCIHSPATYGCICNEGWFGATCASTRSPCDREVSQCRGECVLTSDRAQCDCPYGKTGIYCDQELIPTDVYFTGTRSFVKLKPQTVSSVSLALEAEIKPNKERGLIAFVETPHFYTSLSLQGGVLEYRWTDRLSGVTSLVRSGAVVGLGAWHSVKAGRYGSRLYLWAEGALATEPLLAHAYPHTAAVASVLLGGAEDLATLPFDVMSGPPEPFTGCIRNLHVNNVILPLERQNIIAGQNLGDCDGTACGAETCAGSACVVEDGRARCVCAGSAGGRCRRHAGCSREHCPAPGGQCRGEKCVCSAGYAGLDCQLRVNVTIPQFAGDSLLSLGRSAALRASPQRLGTDSAVPQYVALNFTTAEPMGLLLSIIMDTEYLGLGIENGYLKLAWSSPRELTQSATEEWRLPKPLQMQSKLLPRAGFLTDGEWHVVVLKLDKTNMTIVVDQNLVYNDEPGVNESGYDEVDVLIGGINEEDSAIAKRVFPHNFKGCIDNISTSEASSLIDYNEIYSENIKSCQLFPSA